MAKYLKKYKTREDFENDKKALIHDMPELEIVVGLVDDIEDIEVICDDDRLIHAVYEFPEDIPGRSNLFCESSNIIKRFIVDGIEVDVETANNMSWSKGIHKAAFYIDSRDGDNTLNFQNNEFLSSIVFRENCALQKLPLFSGSSSLKSVNIRSTRFKSIESTTFQNCTSLTTITIPESVTSIEREAFYGCSGITSITIPASVTSIGIKAFYNCSGELTVNCNIPSASSASYGAFYGSKFTKVTIGEEVTSIGKYAFSYCEFISITIPESVTSIGYRAFYSCNGELTVNCDIPSTVSSSDDGTFCSSGFTKVIIGEGVTSIGNFAFYGCYSLTSINIPESVMNIGGSAFAYCSSLTSITIPEGVTSIGNYAFYNCSSLTAINIPEGVTSIGSGAFSGTVWYDSLPDGVVYTGKVLYKYKGTMPANTSIEVKEGTVRISSSAFYNCSNLTSITLPKGLTSIEEAAFRSCNSLTSINIPMSVTNIGNYAFWGCSGLTSITCFAITTPTISNQTFRDVATGGVLKYPQGSDYSSWMSTNQYYLGYYNWTSQEIEV